MITQNLGPQIAHNKVSTDDLTSNFYIPRVLSVLDFLLAIFAPQVTIKIRCIRNFNPRRSIPPATIFQ